MCNTQHNIENFDVKNTNPLISVIIPVYNTLHYLKKCLDSLIEQTLASVEIIVVDDGSSQNIRSLVNMYSDYDQIIYLRNEQPKGPGGARNRGLEIASGKYIAFCDSDDWVDLNFFETIVGYMETSSADIVMTSMSREYATQCEGSKTYMCLYEQEYSLSSQMAIRILSNEYDMGIRVVPACMNKIYRQDFLKRIGARFEEGMYFQGVLFTVYTFLRTNRIVCLPNVTYHHFRRKDSIVQSFDEKHIIDFKKCYDKMKSYFIEHNVYETFRVDYYRLCLHYMNLIVQEIFEFVPNDVEKKGYLRALLGNANSVIQMDEFFDFIDAEQLRRHIQPDVHDTKLY